MLTLAKLSFRYPGNVKGKVIHALDLKIEAGSIFGLTGPSGCGKTTLGNIICGYLIPTAGEIRLDGALVNSPNSDIVMVFQDDGLWPWLTVQQNLLLGRSISSVSSQFNVANMLLKLGLNDISSAYPRQLSGGMRKRVEIGRAVASKPRVIVLDETMKSLDWKSRSLVWGFLKAFSKENPSNVIILISHDLFDIAENCDYCGVMGFGGGFVISELQSSANTQARMKQVADIMVQFGEKETVYET